MRCPKRGGRRVVALVAAVLALSTLASCGPPAHEPRHDPWFDDDSSSAISGNLDEAETRWRREIAAQRDIDPDALLTDDPPRDPDQYGNVAYKDGEPPPTTFWGKMRSGAETVGKASFAAMSVLVTVGMMVAPYLLL